MLFTFKLLLQSGREAEYCYQFISVCPSVSISLAPLDWFSWNFVCRSPMVMARSFSGIVAIYFVLPVLCMTLRLAVMGLMVMRGWLHLNLLPLVAIWYQGGVYVYECLVLYRILYSVAVIFLPNNWTRNKSRNYSEKWNNTVLLIIFSNLTVSYKPVFNKLLSCVALSSYIYETICHGRKLQLQRISSRVLLFESLRNWKQN